MIKTETKIDKYALHLEKKLEISLMIHYQFFKVRISVHSFKSAFLP